MKETVTIFCKNNHQYYDIQRGSTLMEIYQQIGLNLPYPVVAALVNYKVQDLSFLVYKPKDIEFLDPSSPSGMRCYVRTLIMVVSCAVRELYPTADLRIEHPISKGYFCTLQWANPEDERELTPDMIRAIKQRTQEIIAQDRLITAEEKRTKDVMALFHDFRHKNDTDATLFKTLGNPYCRYYAMGDYIDYYTDALMPSSGYVKIFDLKPFFNGMLLQIPNRNNPVELEELMPQDKMFSVFKEYTGWNKILRINNVGEFNIANKNRRLFEMIKLSEALHEKKIAQIADQITTRRPKFVLISGPSSSGKTTFSKRLNIQMMINGIHPVVISMDNYFVNREDTPRDENGEWDFEHFNTLDLDLFRQQLAELMEGKEVSLPTYNFETGKREYRGDKLQLKEDDIVILEGLHALNPDLIPNIPREVTFRIYVSSITSVSLDNHNWISTTDIRLLRRVVRDYRYRGYSARETIARCPSVQRGEVRWIYPYQENADAMFNSALLFELAVLKRHAEPILSEVPKYCDEYTEAHRLLKFLSYFDSISEKEIPPTSFLREFVGGSSFSYK